MMHDLESIMYLTWGTIAFGGIFILLLGGALIYFDRKNKARWH
jgi:LPXTG-motif cell wall-anchored protein